MNKDPIKKCNYEKIQRIFRNTIFNSFRVSGKPGIRKTPENSLQPGKIALNFITKP